MRHTLKEFKICSFYQNTEKKFFKTIVIAQKFTYPKLKYYLCKNNSS